MGTLSSKEFIIHRSTGGLFTWLHTPRGKRPHQLDILGQVGTFLTPLKLQHHHTIPPLPHLLPYCKRIAGVGGHYSIHASILLPGTPRASLSIYRVRVLQNMRTYFEETYPLQNIPPKFRQASIIPPLSTWSSQSVARISHRGYGWPGLGRTYSAAWWLAT